MSEIIAAIREILINPETPEDLTDKICEFVTANSSGSIQLFWTLPVIERLLDFIPEDSALERRLREEEEKKKAKKSATV